MLLLLSLDLENSFSWSELGKGVSYCILIVGGQPGRAMEALTVTARIS